MYRTVTQAFDELIKRQSLTSQQRDTAVIRIRTIREFLNNEFSMYESAFVTGSFARGTICSGERDIDIMAPFQAYGSGKYWERYEDDSSEFLYFVRNALNSRYATTNVSSKQVAVTLDFNIIKVDLVPCFSRNGDGGGYFMPDGQGSWIDTNPKYHTQLINNAENGRTQSLKKLIKLAKKWNIENGKHLRSFHLEMIIERMWRDAPITFWSDAMKQTIDLLPSWLTEPFYDPWDSSKRIDTYLSSSTKDMVIRMLTEDSQNAEDAEWYRNNGYYDSAFERWNRVFGQTFPSRVI